MSTIRSHNWAVSFADLTLLLLGFFVILYARAKQPMPTQARMEDVVRPEDVALKPETPFELRATSLFEPGEARLTPEAHAKFAAIGRKAASQGRTVRIDSRGRDSASPRFEGWELAAARAAATARAVEEGGLAESRIQIAVPAPQPGEPPYHRIDVRIGR